MKMLFRHKGSAYLMVIGGLVVCMFALLYSLKSSMAARQTQARLQDRLQIFNVLQACHESLYHQLRATPVDDLSAFPLSGQLVFDDAICNYTGQSQLMQIFTITAKARLKDVEASSQRVFRVQVTETLRTRRVDWERRLVSDTLDW